jgi:hypothetical protein
VADGLTITPAKPPLGGVLWLFIIWKISGILLSAAMLVFLVVWLIPTQAKLAGGILAPDLVLEGILLVGEILATAYGIALIVRRHRSMRRFWIVLLGVSSVLLAVAYVSGRGEEEALFLLLTTLAWLAYWTAASRPRQLQLATFWTRR